MILLASYNEARSRIEKQLATVSGPSSLDLQMKLTEVDIAEGKLTEAEKRLNSLDKTWQNTRQQAVYLTNLGYLQLNKGRQDIALERLQEALQLLQQSEWRHSVEAAQCLSHLSLACFAAGKYNQAEDHGVIALQMRRDLLGDQHEWVAASYNDLGLVYSQIDPDKALAYYDMALPIYQKIHGEVHPKIAIVNTNMGALYRDLELYGDAINNFETALGIWRKWYPDGHPNEAFVLRNLGQTYVKMGNHANAYDYFEQALKKYRQVYGQQHPDIASTLNQIGTLKLADQQFEDALTRAQEALLANIPGFTEGNPAMGTPLENYYNATVLLFSLTLKAHAYEDWYFGKSLKLEPLRLALVNLQRCDSLIDNIRHHSTDESDKISLGSLANEVYEDGVRVALALSEATLQVRMYEEVAFYFAEKSKSAVLQESIADAQAKSYSGIPTELVEEEKDLKSTLAFLTQKLSLKPAPEEEKYLRESLLQLNLDYNQFIKRLETTYPNYYNLKFNSTAPSVADLQARLTPEQAIVSFFLGEKTNRLYQFIITKKSLKVRNLTLPDHFERLLKGFINGIYYREFSSYRQAAQALHRVLVPPTRSGIREWIVIPAGRLGTVPFEALPWRNTGGENFQSVDYVANHVAISYEFSAGLMMQKTQAKPTGPAAIFLCAPVTFPEQDDLTDLPASEDEVNTIAKLFGPARAQLALKADANEWALKQQNLKDYRFLHFATHGIVDERDPELSRIFLNTDNHEDGHLFAGEIYNLSLDADLAVLSACQTGLGKISKGEGVIGLSRALVYAGARNLMVSFWSVADESTAQLMTNFYSILLQQTTMNVRLALQAAKQKMVRETAYKEPFYWAPFILIGN